MLRLFSSHAPRYHRVTVRSSRRLLQAAAPLIVLIAMPGPVFELDRYLVPKELILHLGAFGAALLALRHARRLPLATVDLPLIGFALLSLISAVLATNPWLALRATGVTVAGLAIFWTTRAIARAGLSRPLVAMLAFASVLGAATGLHPDAELMDRVNPVYVPRNHLVEEALSAGSAGDLDPLARLLDAVTDPYQQRPGLDRYACAAPSDFGPYRTFCGT